MTVEELIEHLKTMNQKAKVVRVGHFGELYEMHKYDFEEKTNYSPGGRGTYKVGNFPVVHVEPPDIGPEPD